VYSDFTLSGSMTLTSFVNRAYVHLVGFDPDSGQCTSAILDITKKATEFMFKEKVASRSDEGSHSSTTNNCLLDCHYDVWTRFPVLPAVERRTKTSTVDLPPKCMICVSNHDGGSFLSYFGNMIKSFEQKTKKPTGKELRSVSVHSLTYSQLYASLLETRNRDTSKFRTGEWIIDVLCLIPIHLAITRENRFVPLKDGITSAEYEKSLLGADVSTVVDSISFGWYESILQSYFSTKVGSV